MRDLVPQKILWRKDKIGFSTPEQRWLGHKYSPVPSSISRYGLKEYDKHFIWKFYVAERLISQQ